MQAHAQTRGWSAGRWTAALILALLAWRVAQLFLSPLQLYPDEAQYWLWSRRLDWGYYSKPPVIGWAIRATTAVGGDGEAWVRLSAPLFHALAATALASTARRLFDARAGLAAAAIYLLMPGVLLSSQVVATDAPLLAFLAISLRAGAALWEAPAGARRLGAAAAMGAALGLAALSKYAAFYAVGGLLAHAALDAEGRRRLWTRQGAGVAAAAFFVVLAPNLVWNALHGFQTFAHTAADADLGREARAARRLDPLGAPRFLLSQFGVFGPTPFAVLLAGAAALARRRADAMDRWLLAMTLPALLVVTAEAALARANANWAGAAYASGSLLAARAWAAGRPWRRPLTVSLVAQAALAVVFSLAVVRPDWADAAGLGNSLKRARGWREAASAVRTWRDAAMRSRSVSALAVDDRFLFNALAYYGREWVQAPGAPPLRMWVHEATPQNQAEAVAPLRPREGAHVAFVSGVWREEAQRDFARVDGAHEVSTPLDKRHARALLLFVGEGFAPVPREK